MANVRNSASVILQLSGIFLVGFYIPRRTGSSMLDPFFLMPFGCLSAILVGPILIEMQRLHPEQSAAVQVRQTVQRACGSVLAILLVSLASLNLMPWRGEWLLPQWIYAVDAALVSVAITTVVAACTALLLRRLPPGLVKWLFRGLVVCAYFLYRNLPSRWSDFGIEKISGWGITPVALAVVSIVAALDAGLLRLLARPSPPASRTGVAVIN